MVCFTQLSCITHYFTGFHQAGHEEFYAHNSYTNTQCQSYPCSASAGTAILRTTNAVFKSRESLDLIKEVAMEFPVAVKMIGKVTQCVKQNLPKYHKAFFAYQLLP
jgi:hypothetical protein